MRSYSQLPVGGAHGRRCVGDLHVQPVILVINCAHRLDVCDSQSVSHGRQGDYKREEGQAKQTSWEGQGCTGLNQTDSSRSEVAFD
jgi:hypothetical protein